MSKAPPGPKELALRELREAKGARSIERTLRGIAEAAERFGAVNVLKKSAAKPKTSRHPNTAPLPLIPFAGKAKLARGGKGSPNQPKNARVKK